MEETRYVAAEAEVTEDPWGYLVTDDTDRPLGWHTPGPARSVATNPRWGGRPLKVYKVTITIEELDA